MGENMGMTKMKKLDLIIFSLISLIILVSTKAQAAVLVLS